MSHTHLTLEERIRIEVFVSEGLSCRKIARQLGRHHTTIARELRRGQLKKWLSVAIVPGLPSTAPGKGERYRASTAV